MKKNLYINKFCVKWPKTKHDAVQSTSVENCLEMMCTFQHFQNFVVVDIVWCGFSVDSARESRISLFTPVRASVNAELLCAESAVLTLFSCPIVLSESDPQNWGTYKNRRLFFKWFSSDRGRGIDTRFSADFRVSLCACFSSQRTRCFTSKTFNTRQIIFSWKGGGEKIKC